ncbi:hypothetical protein GBO97_07590 [Pediococcus acidilactici]|uniref:hypothetical protein n=1 Tax=Pediococcus acidilactici TaxID=1254 RepID=UPI00132FF42B|nr:hypothetical protein [Pediococcus acidilactici]KAF0353797.1 hypothetical protein GBO47_07600 [Pediococcus acidilactici]KAF0358135.1 hypothetical protein GBO51_07585 [Pediococcus acidilactici]KAF0447004.1 hypothetical protein GBO97_07590 [Pediococcus acidilactici]KAF0557336.1 hypothetical protein GBP47_07560 [Pediococcus acidilactici]
MAINLDSKLQTVKEFVVGGKKRSVVYDDKFMLAIAEADIRIGKDLEKVTNLTEDEAKKLDKLEVSKQVDVLSDVFDKVNKDLVRTLDSAFGKGVGEELYEYFHYSTNSLYAIVEALNEYSDVVKQEQKSRKSKVKNYYENKNKK